jgi:hypothetical protein
MNCSRGDVILVPIPFADLSGRKVRPAVVLGGSAHGDLFVLPITSRPQNIDLPLGNWAGAGLNVPCGIKAQLATIKSSLVVKRTGSLDPMDAAALDSSLRRWLVLP